MSASVNADSNEMPDTTNKLASTASYDPKPPGKSGIDNVSNAIVPAYIHTESETSNDSACAII